MHDTGILDLGNLGVTLQTMKNSRVYGPQATMAIQGGRKFPSLPAIVDEHGTLTYRQVDDMSTARARAQDWASTRVRSWACSAVTIADSSSRWPPAESSVPGWF